MPIGHNEIIFLPTVSVIEEETEFGTSYHIVPPDNPTHPVFSLDEQEILTRVAQRFKSISGKTISEHMHDEDAYKRTAEGEVILYSLVGNIDL